jgi:hypothetical protein
MGNTALLTYLGRRFRLFYGLPGCRYLLANRFGAVRADKGDLLGQMGPPVLFGVGKNRLGLAAECTVTGDRGRGPGTVDGRHDTVPSFLRDGGRTWLHDGAAFDLRLRG